MSMKRTGYILLTIASALLAFAACVKEESATIEFNESAYQMLVGETKDMAAELAITNSNEKPVFSTSDTTVATVTAGGRLTALAAGEVNLKAVIEGLEASCLVQISEIKADTIIINAPKTIAVGQAKSITVTVKPAEYDRENLEWTFNELADGLEYETEKVSASEYTVKFVNFVKGGKLAVTVSDSNSEMTQTAEIEVVEDGIPATELTIECPEQLTETVEAAVRVVVKPENYDAKFLDWTFVPTSEDLGFKSEKVSDTEYKVSFASYVKNGSVTVKVTDRISSNFTQSTIKVLELEETGVNAIRVNPASLSLMVGDEPVSLQVVTDPENYDRSLLEWSTSDDKVAVVSDGVVTVVGEGKASVKVKDKVSGKEAVCEVTVTVPVKEVVIETIGISHPTLSMRVGEETVQLTAICYDKDGSVVENYADLVWSAVPMVVTEDGREVEVTVVEVTQQGVVTPKNEGTTQITVADRKNIYTKATCNVTVSPAAVKVQEVTLLPASKVIAVGDTYSLTAVVLPENAENKTLTYKSSDEKVATVTADGTVTGVAAGEAYITATASNGVSGECKVIVADGIYLNNTEITLTVGMEAVLKADMASGELPEESVTWTSSQPQVASVEGGVVKALQEGETVITAALGSSKAECKVIVVPDKIEFDISLVSSDNTLSTKGLMQDKSVRLLASYLRRDNGEEYVPASTQWKSSDETIAVVDADGNVTAVAEYIEQVGFSNGKKVTITHVADEKEKSMEITVVKAMPESIEVVDLPEVDGQKMKMMHGDSFTFGAKVYPAKASQAAKWMASGGDMGFETGEYKATAVGWINIIAYAYDDTGVKTSFDIEVLPVVMTDMTISNAALDMTTGAQAALSVDITPSNASYQTLTWTSSDEDVATVDQHGVVTAMSAGTAVITVTQKENGMSRTCEVTVKDPVTETKVGDYYYSDGTTSPELDASKTVIGVVFSLDNPVQMGDPKLAEDCPDCTHGYVVAMVEYADQDFGSVSTYNGHGYYNGIGYDANLIVDQDKANGYGNTLAHRDLNASKPDYCKFFNATDGVVATHTAAVASPESASAWYIPSYKEMQMLNENRVVVNESLTAAGADAVAEPYEREESHDEMRTSDWYWTSTIHGTWYERGKSWDHSKYPFDLSKDSWTTYTQNSMNCKVRVILAF